MRLYRTYKYGIRFTCEARNAREARERFKAIASAYAGQRNHKRMKARPDLTADLFFSARTLSQLNQAEG